MLGNDFRFEGPVAVARHFDLYRAELPLHFLPAFSVAVVPSPAPFPRVLCIAEMMLHLGVHRPLYHSFGELFEQTLWADNLIRCLAR